jgi:hypothetical protein
MNLTVDVDARAKTWTVDDEKRTKRTETLGQCPLLVASE